MNDTLITTPFNYAAIQEASARIHFSMPSDLQTGCLIRTLAASRPGGDFLELGTGTGLSLSWIVEGMDKNSSVISIDNNGIFADIARGFFQEDDRILVVCTDGEEWIQNNQQKKFDLIFADARPGKYSCLDETLALLKTGGIYLIDDMLPPPNWPEGHDKKANAFDPCA
jgi:predicted O-methyltransferase YrrM